MMKTCRRELLDRFLCNHGRYFTGAVLDIGGKQYGKRGDFRPPIFQVDSWLYVNIDLCSRPDVLALAERLPFPNNSFDTFLMCEILEHLAYPEVAMAEAARILRPSGYGVISVPFLYPVHADPHDYQRWTETKLRTVLACCGLEPVWLFPMGGAFAVVADICQIRLCEFQNRARIGRWLGYIVLALVKKLLKDTLYQPHPRINTGYAVIVTKATI